MLVVGGLLHDIAEAVLFLLSCDFAVTWLCGHLEGFVTSNCRHTCWQKFSSNPYFFDSTLSKQLTVTEGGNVIRKATAIRWKPGMVGSDVALLKLTVYTHVHVCIWNRCQ